MRCYAMGGGKERRASTRRRRAWLRTQGQPLKPRGIASPLAGRLRSGLSRQDYGAAALGAAETAVTFHPEELGGCNSLCESLLFDTCQSCLEPASQIAI